MPVVARAQEGRIGRGDGAEPGGRAPEERSQRQQLGAGVAVVEIAPQRVEHRPNQQRPGGDKTHLGAADVEFLHDRGGQRADEQLIGLVQQHEGEEHANYEPAIARCCFHWLLRSSRCEVLKVDFTSEKRWP